MGASTYSHGLSVGFGVHRRALLAHRGEELEVVDLSSLLAETSNHADREADIVRWREGVLSISVSCTFTIYCGCQSCAYKELGLFVEGVGEGMWRLMSSCRSA